MENKVFFDQYLTSLASIDVLLDSAAINILDPTLHRTQGIIRDAHLRDVCTSVASLSQRLLDSLSTDQTRRRGVYMRAPLPLAPSAQSAALLDHIATHAHGAASQVLGSVGGGSRWSPSVSSILSSLSTTAAPLVLSPVPDLADSFAARIADDCDELQQWHRAFCALQCCSWTSPEGTNPRPRYSHWVAALPDSMLQHPEVCSSRTKEWVDVANGATDAIEAAVLAASPLLAFSRSKGTKSESAVVASSVSGEPVQAAAPAAKKPKLTKGQRRAAFHDAAQRAADRLVEVCRAHQQLLADIAARAEAVAEESPAEATVAVTSSGLAGAQDAYVRSHLLAADALVGKPTGSHQLSIVTSDGAPTVSWSHVVVREDATALKTVDGATLEGQELAAEAETAAPAVANPKNFPLGPDGQPIPVWQWKLRGLRKVFECEICGGVRYAGPLAWQRHFTEWRHVAAIRNLGLPMTVHLHGISSIQEARELATSLSSDAAAAAASATEIQFEDSSGHILDKDLFELMAAEGLLMDS